MMNDDILGTGKVTNPVKTPNHKGFGLRDYETKSKGI